MNLLPEGRSADYVNTGTWATKAIKEAQILGKKVNVAASSEDKNFSYIPRDISYTPDAAYVHITSNNTIKGTQWAAFPDTKGVPLIGDMSSDILSRPFDPSPFGLIYAGAQKNLGPSGVAFAIVKDSLLENVYRPVPTMLSYKIHAENDSLYNTPPCVAIYACLQTLKWLRNLGGLNVIYKINAEKAAMLYDEIDRNKMFMSPLINVEDRSLMNVVFVFKPEYKELEEKFLELAKSRGLVGIKGHRSVGGFRASIYNAMALEGVKTLVAAMKEFEAQV